MSFCRLLSDLAGLRRLNTHRMVTIVHGLMALVILGCGSPTGPQRVPLRGHVFCEGEPLPQGLIRFLAEGQAAPAAAAAVMHGEFVVSPQEGPIPGRYRVEIQELLTQGFELDDEAGYAAQVERQRGQPAVQSMTLVNSEGQRFWTMTITAQSAQTPLEFDARRPSPTQSDALRRQ
ncbi:MAG: hypothetical protein KatS3mg113_0530 [Planctomycetaceae bacterium]|nr:MAG: hypothetical protein KatS3mg113_0530 [Planctomycetaceae bacterium]